MSLISIFFASFIIGFSGAASPGPLLTVTISESYRRGFWAGPLLMIGHSLLELVLLVLIFLGLADYLKLPAFVGFVSIVGSLVLLYLGTGIIRDIYREHMVFNKESGQVKPMNPLISGILVSLSNPYWLIWWVTIGLGLALKSAEFSLAGICAFFTGHIGADFVWYSIVSYSVTSGKKVFSEKFFRIVLLACGIFLIYLAVYFMITGISKILPLTGIIP